MWAVSFLLLFSVVHVEPLVCRIGEKPCGSNHCFDPSSEHCINETATIQCLNSCNGTCYSNSQYCYNNMKICNNSELVCDIKIYSRDYFPLGIRCYDPSQYTCHNNTLCSKEYTCGTQCVDSVSVCIKNQTISCGFLTGYDAHRYIGICGPQKQCYFTTSHVCLNRNTVCQQSQELCGGTCYTRIYQNCVNGTVQCRNSCNGTCYLDHQYCYNNSIICKKGQSVCDLKDYWYPDVISIGLACYDPSSTICYNNELCDPYYLCGTRCGSYYSICINDTLCTLNSLFDGSPSEQMDICGPQQQCYDARESVCLNGTIVCDGLNAQLCGINCFKPDVQICVNGTVQCLHSCNGTCYSNSQYCYNNEKICYYNQLVCDVKYFSTLLQPYTRPPPPNLFFGLTCYDPSGLNCYNNSLCLEQDVCGTQCLIDRDSICVKNRTICLRSYDSYDSIDACGLQCYDKTKSICLGNDDILCPLDSQLCFDVCYNPQFEYCIANNSTIDCVKDPSAPNCLSPGTNGD